MGAPIVFVIVVAVGAAMLGLGYMWGKEQRAPVPEREVVTSDFTLMEYMQASEELLSRWSYSEKNREVTYKTGKWELHWRPAGLLTDSFYFDPMAEFAYEARKVQLNTPAKRRALNFDYRATMHDEKVGPEMFRAMGFLRDAKYDKATGLISGVHERSWEEVMTIYNRLLKAETTRGWERGQARFKADMEKAEGPLQ